MATFFTDYSQPQTQTSLSDMINTARGAQAYQQSQQMNPLAVQRATADTQTAQQGAATGAMELQKAQQANQERLKMMEFMKIPENYQTNGRVDIDKLNKSIPSIAPMTGHAYIENMTKLGQAQSTAESASTKLTTDQRQLFGPALIGLSNAKVADPKIYDSMLDHITEQYPGNKHVSDLAQSYKKMLKMASPSGAANPALPQLAGMAGTSLLSGEQVQAATAPKATLTDVGGQPTTSIIQPSVFGSQPTITVGTPGGMQPTLSPITGADMGTAFNPSAAEPLAHPVRNANQPYRADPSEAIDTAAGAKLRQDLLGHLNNTAEINRNLGETFSAITKLTPDAWYRSGVAGSVVRNLSNLVGSSDYQQLSKDLANVQLSQLAAQGGSMQTDAAKSLQGKANGSETYNPDVLLNIVKRTAAKQTELQLQAPAAQLASQRFGDNNAAKFQKEWSKNADSKVFEAMNINDAIQNPAEKKKAIDELLGRDPKARALFLKKYDNINKLIQTGSL